MIATVIAGSSFHANAEAEDAIFKFGTRCCVTGVWSAAISRIRTTSRIVTNATQGQAASFGPC